MSGNLLTEFTSVGAYRFRAVLDAAEITLVAALFGADDRPGQRLGREQLSPIAGLIGPNGTVSLVAAELLGAGAKPVRALLLDKSPAANWRLGWHQDRTIAVQDRIDVPGFCAWSVKGGQLHVQPPEEITARMVTLRVHVDAVDATNAPLQVLPGSHVLGRLDNGAVAKLASEHDGLTCFAEAGDVWAYSAAIVHASAEQRGADRRRVLQLDYSADALPGGLEWAALL